MKFQYTVSSINVTILMYSFFLITTAVSTERNETSRLVPGIWSDNISFKTCLKDLEVRISIIITSSLEVYVISVIKTAHKTTLR